MIIINKVVLIGRLTKDPQIKFTPGTGTAVCNFTMAVNRRFKKEGQPDADFIPIVVWGKQAESTANYMKKGSQLSVAGRIETRSYDGKSGKVFITEVVADEVSFLEFGKKNNNTNNTQSGDVPQDYFGASEVDNSDMPF